MLVRTSCHGSHGGGQEQKYFSPPGPKLYFHVNSSRKNSTVLTPNMAVLSHGWKPRIQSNDATEKKWVVDDYMWPLLQSRMKIGQAAFLLLTEQQHVQALTGRITGIENILK